MCRRLELCYMFKVHCHCSLQAIAKKKLLESAVSHSDRFLSISRVSETPLRFCHCSSASLFRFSFRGAIFRCLLPGSVPITDKLVTTYCDRRILNRQYNSQPSINPDQSHPRINQDLSRSRSCQPEASSRGVGFLGTSRLVEGVSSRRH